MANHDNDINININTNDNDALIARCYYDNDDDNNGLSRSRYKGIFLEQCMRGGTRVAEKLKKWGKSKASRAKVLEAVVKTGSAPQHTRICPASLRTPEP